MHNHCIWPHAHGQKKQACDFFFFLGSLPSSGRKIKAYFHKPVYIRPYEKIHLKRTSPQLGLFKEYLLYTPKIHIYYIADCICFIFSSVLPLFYQ